jgi:hypothetical protein
MNSSDKPGQMQRQGPHQWSSRSSGRFFRGTGAGESQKLLFGLHGVSVIVSRVLDLGSFCVFCRQQLTPTLCYI